MAIYVLSSPGRIDTIDGQARYEVAYNWLLEGRPVIRDPALGGIRGRNDLRYSYYGPAGSVAGMPFARLGMLTDDPPGETSRFMFSLVCAFLGALVSVILFLFYLELGIPIRPALAWTFVSAFATMLWPASTSSLDNAQHAFFVILALYLAFLSAKRNSLALAAVGGLVAGVLLLYQEYLMVLIPALAIATLGSTQTERTIGDSNCKGESSSSRALFGVRLKRAVQDVSDALRWVWQTASAKESHRRFLLFLASNAVGAALCLMYHKFRFGSIFTNSKLAIAARAHVKIFGNPVAGGLTILASPGKSIFLYSPVLVIGLWGFSGLRRRYPHLATAIAASSILLVSFISCISFAGGDWCWGPRYLVPLLPLWALAFPFASAKSRLRRYVMVAVLSAGFIVQGLALSVEHQRYLFGKAVNDHFWAEDEWFYFKHSALFARPGEALSLKDGVPLTAQIFKPPPLSESVTYTIFGPPPPRRLAPIWMRQFRVFYLPRPWPLWMWTLPPERRPINLEAVLGGLLGSAVLGYAFITRGMQALESGGAPQEVKSEEKVVCP
jgi:hypothetical protein